MINNILTKVFYYRLHLLTVHIEMRSFFTLKQIRNLGEEISTAHII